LHKIDQGSLEKIMGRPKATQQEVSPDKLSFMKSFAKGKLKYSYPYTKANQYRLDTTAKNIIEPWLYAMGHFVGYQHISEIELNDKKVQKATKIRGELIFQTYNLCKECHSLQKRTGISVEWNVAYDWLGKIWWDFIGTEFEESMHELNVYNSNHKKAVLDRKLSKLTAMKRGENPFTQFKDANGLNILVDIAIALANNPSINPQHKEFTNRYWKPFLNSYRADIQEMRSDRWGWVKFNDNGTDNQIISSRGRPKNSKTG
jgi:hypothetical protein